MNLTFDEGKLFYDLFAALLSFVNRKLEVSAEQFSNSREYTSTPPEARVAIRNTLFDHRELIDEFVGENPANLDDNPIVWMLEVNGFVVDVRNAPREVQEAAFENGLIPYIPADRAEQEKA